ncbi:phosphoribosylanthranilate isomerase [Herbiconiux sp. CPCC 203407]|uniref:N-(5'-phosphoribosyl)anthranilate isomerase n=1 Tax=Herbiconiux oxytropis TaxID=2970915 RepID=A0AA41XEH2_9MICO|nr:phosphoribosylanthranilate isomerase [Herbiconiux oxytropis]MCS5721103.1 phosphoribosylanthranilate isomerase [Herbiconiux oxytropis]MCS5724755.1 phosphoribosylanthranilate isomerase [Herbiconiux oxytropis]
MYIKICGLSTPETVRTAVDAGADAVGFVFAPGSPRTVDPGLAARLVADVPETVETVGVFRDQPIDEVIGIARAAGVGTVQLHGSEPDDDLRRLVDEGLRPFRALSASAFGGLSEARRSALGAYRLLIDAAEPGAGVTFDETELGRRPEGFWLLAGGLTPENAARLFRFFEPSGVDVSSGVESARGVKDPVRIEAFVAAARGAAGRASE